MLWALVAIIAAGTTAGDLLQSKAMKRHGEIHDFRPGALCRALTVVVSQGYIVGAVVGYAVSFFALMRLLSLSQLSFAIPATAVSYVLETVLARLLLKECVTWHRWAGATLVACGVALLSV